MLAIVVAVVALLVVLATSLIKNVDMSAQVKNLIATVLSVAGAGLTILFAADVDLSPENLLELSLGVYGASQLIYNFIMRGTTVERNLAAVNVLPE